MESYHRGNPRGFPLFFCCIITTQAQPTNADRVVRQDHTLSDFTPNTKTEDECRRFYIEYNETKKQKREPLSKFSFKWCHRDSNQGHKDFQSFSRYANQKQASDCNQLSYCTLQAVLLLCFCLFLLWFNSWFTCRFTQIVITEKVLMYINICFYCLTTTYVLVAPLRIDGSPLGLHHIPLELNP